MLPEEMKPVLRCEIECLFKYDDDPDEIVSRYREMDLNPSSLLLLDLKRARKLLDRILAYGFEYGIKESMIDAIKEVMPEIVREALPKIAPLEEQP